ncbi:MAG: hypothetical protein J0I07_28500 [Myxococcales bacterium]|nr:hypothetical protein [Myxococcales bacterium]
MTRIRILPVISISLLVASACGSEGNGKKQGGGSGGADDPGGSRSAPAAALTADERTCEEQYRTQIAWTHRCGGIINESPAAIARFRKLCAHEINAPGAEKLRDARLKCGERRKNAACDAVIPECELPPGSLANGAPCGSRSQCQSRYCRIDDTGCGVCATPGAAGSACTSAVDCAFGENEVSTCDPQEQGATTGVCNSWKVVKAGETCGKDSLCNATSHCDVADEKATTGTCLENEGVGGKCDNKFSCKLGLACISGKCAARPKEGQACKEVDDCADGLACDKTCQRVVYVGVDEECGLVRRCARGRCIQKVQPGPNGEASAAGPATCVDPIADGGACGQEQANTGKYCDDFARCVGGRCTFVDPAQCK